MRRALVNCLPEKIRWRSDKGNLGPNFRQGLLSFERQRLEQLILENSQAIEAYVDVASLRTVYQRYVSQGAKEDVIPVWLAITLALWLYYEIDNLSIHETATNVCVNRR